MKTIFNNSNTPEIQRKSLKPHLVSIVCLIVGVLSGALIIHSIYKASENRRITETRVEIAKLFEKFVSEAEYSLEKVQPQITSLESDISNFQYVQKPEDIKSGPYRARLAKIGSILNEVNEVLDRTAKDTERLVDKQKVVLPDVFTTEQLDRISKLKKLYSSLSQNLQFLEMQIEMIEQLRNQIEVAQSKQQNQMLIEEIRNVVKEIDNLQRNQNELIMQVKSNKPETENRDNNEILAFAKMQTDMAQTMILANAIQNANNYPAPYYYNSYYQNYEPPLVIGTGYKVVGERMGSSYGPTPAYRIYPVAYPSPYIPCYSDWGVNHYGPYSVYNVGRRIR